MKASISTKTLCWLWVACNEVQVTSSVPEFNACRDQLALPLSRPDGALMCKIGFAGGIPYPHIQNTHQKSSQDLAPMHKEINSIILIGNKTSEILAVILSCQA